MLYIYRRGSAWVEYRCKMTEVECIVREHNIREYNVYMKYYTLIIRDIVRVNNRVIEFF